MGTYTNIVSNISLSLQLLAPIITQYTHNHQLLINQKEKTKHFDALPLMKFLAWSYTSSLILTSSFILPQNETNQISN